jgi:hypothetical protein
MIKDSAFPFMSIASVISVRNKLASPLAGKGSQFL